MLEHPCSRRKCSKDLGNWARQAAVSLCRAYCSAALPCERHKVFQHPGPRNSAYAHYPHGTAHMALPTWHCHREDQSQRLCGDGRPRLTGPWSPVRRGAIATCMHLVKPGRARADDRPPARGGWRAGIAAGVTPGLRAADLPSGHLGRQRRWLQPAANSILARSSTPFAPQPWAPGGTSGRNRS
jgi:hypothetical protein